MRPSKLFVASLILLVVSSISLFAATYTVTTTAAQETKLTRYRTVLNAAGAGYADNNAMVVDLCTKNIGAGIKALDDGDAAALALVALNATQAQRDAGCTALGGTVVNGRCQ